MIMRSELGQNPAAGQTSLSRTPHNRVLRIIAEVHRPCRDHHPSPAWYRDHAGLNAARTVRSRRSSILPLTRTWMPPGKAISIVPALFVTAPAGAAGRRGASAPTGDHDRHGVWQPRSATIAPHRVFGFAPPRVEKTAADPMPSGNLADPRTGQNRFGNDRRLLFRTPTPPPFRSGKNLACHDRTFLN